MGPVSSEPGGISQNGYGPFRERGPAGAAGARQCPLSGDHEALWGSLCMALTEPHWLDGPRTAVTHCVVSVEKVPRSLRSKSRDSRCTSAQKGSRDGCSAMFPLRPAPFQHQLLGRHREGAIKPRRLGCWDTTALCSEWRHHISPQVIKC